jgi:drug/metabolite transporter (DMT)-like permease
MPASNSLAPNRWAPALILLLLGFVWGSSFILMKFGLFARDGSALFPPIQLAALRIFIAGATLLPISLTHLARLPRDRWKWIAAVGVIGSFIPAMLFATAQVHLPSAMAGMLNALSPLWTLVIGVAFFAVSLKKKQVLGIVIGLIGTVWLILAQSHGLGAIALTPEEGMTRVWKPAMMLVAATVCYGVSVNITREKLQGLPSRVIAACSLGLVGIPAFGLFISGEIPHLIVHHPDGLHGLFAVVVLASVGTAGALVLFNQLIAWTSAVVAASVTYIIPIFAALWGWWDGEILTFQHLLAGTCIILGVWVTNSGRKPTAPQVLKS